MASDTKSSPTLSELLPPDEQKAVLAILEQPGLARDVDKLSVELLQLVMTFVTDHIDAFTKTGMLPDHPELTIALVVGWILGFGSTRDALDHDAQMRAVAKNSLVATLAAGWSMKNTERVRLGEVN